MPLQINLYGSPALRHKGERITTFDAALRDLAREMIETMNAAEGIGIAAQQVGRALMVCIVDISPCDSNCDYLLDGKRPPLDLIMPLALVNPEVEALPAGEDFFEEGCLSFPGIRGDVKRPIAVRVKFQDINGNARQLECDGIFARCVQHEVDHLNGVLFIDRMEKRARRQIEPHLKRLKNEARDLPAAQFK